MAPNKQQGLGQETLLRLLKVSSTLLHGAAPSFAGSLALLGQAFVSQCSSSYSLSRAPNPSF